MLDCYHNTDTDNLVGMIANETCRHTTAENQIGDFTNLILFTSLREYSQKAICTVFLKKLASDVADSCRRR
jgi:hypothetical protein